MGDNRDLLLSIIGTDFVQKKDSNKFIEQFLLTVDEGQLLSVQKGGNLQDVISHINSSLNSSKRRLEGLCLLQAVVQQCETQVFQEHAKCWLTLLVGTIQSYDPYLTLQLACHVTGELLSHCGHFPELSRDLANSSLPQLLLALIDAKPQWKKAAIDCISRCLTYFHGPCGPFKGKIENVLMCVFDGYDAELIQCGSECWALLCQAGGGGSMGVKHTQFWTTQCDKLLHSAHHTLDNLYDDEGVVDSARPGRLLNLLSVPDTEPERTHMLTTRFKALTSCINKMLSVNMSAVAKVPVSEILALLCRTLAITPKQLLLRPTKEKVVLSAALPIIQSEAFTLLNTLISSCGSYLSVYSATINKLFLQTLIWTTTSTAGYGRTKPYSGLRCEVYKCLLTWVSIGGMYSDVESNTGDLLPHFLADATPQVDSVKLDSKAATKLSQDASSGKKRRKGAFSDMGQISAQRKVDLVANHEVCTHALKCLRMIILRIGCFLKPKHYKAAVNFVVSSLLSLQQTKPAQIPYTNTECRTCLYQLLQACVVISHPQMAPPTQCALAIFSKGQQDTSLQVSSTCIEALAVCEAIIHPRAPPLYTPLPPPQPIAEITPPRPDTTSGIQNAALQQTIQTLNEDITGNPSQPYIERIMPVVVDNAEEDGRKSAIVIESEEDEEEEDLVQEVSSEEEEEEEVVYLASKTGDVSATGHSETGQIQEASPQIENPVLLIEESTEIEEVTGKREELEASESKGIEKGNLEIKNTSEEKEAGNDPQAKECIESENSNGNRLESGNAEVEADIADQKGQKRKMEEDIEDSDQKPSPKKQEVEEADLMIEAFVDASPDSD